MLTIVSISPGGRTTCPNCTELRRIAGKLGRSSLSADRWRADNYVNMTPRRHPSAVGIGTASRLTDVEVHTLRYWEEEFKGLIEPIRTEGGQRRYGPEHLDVLLRIKTLLRDELLTIPGARRKLIEEAEVAQATEAA